MTLLQLTTATNIIHFLYSATWSVSAKSFFNWKEESKKVIYEQLVKTFFDKGRIIKIIQDFIMFTKQDDEWKKDSLDDLQEVINRLGGKIENRKSIFTQN